ncbi:hypothetical protein V0288_13735 [Pannus brasiliensis CCIBt3594]|uniref:Uncharacterized protein n=1 Tax=Pannus brasiliensis CCIBt3594 TaxID=1427578 RepID=A0AAW9QMS2_9CHRO
MNAGIIAFSPFSGRPSGRRGNLYCTRIPPLAPAKNPHGNRYPEGRRQEAGGRRCFFGEDKESFLFK